MRRYLHQSRAGLFLLCVAGLVTFAYAQVSTYPTGSSSTSSAGSNHGGASPGVSRTLDGDYFTPDPTFSHRQMVSRREEMRRRMVENAARLLMLTRDLQTELQSREPNEADAKRLDEIAKLARAVRDQMRQ